MREAIPGAVQHGAATDGPATLRGPAFDYGTHHQRAPQ
jgi:hypothetical protein